MFVIRFILAYLAEMNFGNGSVDVPRKRIVDCNRHNRHTGSLKDSQNRLPLSTGVLQVVSRL